METTHGVIPQPLRIDAIEEVHRRLAERNSEAAARAIDSVFQDAAAMGHGVMRVTPDPITISPVSFEETLASGQQTLPSMEHVNCVRGRTIARLKDNGYGFFAFITDEEKRAAQIRAVKYITTLSNTAGTDVSTWDMGQVFGDGTGLLLTERRDINKRFFAHRDGLANQTPLLTEEQLARITHMETRVPGLDLANLQRDLRNSLERAQGRYNDYLMHVRNARAAQLRLDGFERKPLDLHKQVETIMRGSFWELLTVRPEYLRFRTKSRIVLSYKNQRQNIDASVDLGRFAFIVDPANARVTWDYDYCDDLVLVNGYPHPHLVSDGGVCFGTAGHMAADALTGGKLVDLMTLISTILMEYNPDSAYVAIHDLVRERERVEARKRGEEVSDEPEEQEEQDENYEDEDGPF